MTITLFKHGQITVEFLLQELFLHKNKITNLRIIGTDDGDCPAATFCDRVLNEEDLFKFPTVLPALKSLTLLSLDFNKRHNGYLMYYISQGLPFLTTELLKNFNLNFPHI
ncbi:hypothetical protein HDU92_008431, partial [Lobulomyces angularis]